MKKYAIGDIHGCNKTFLALLDKLQLSTSDELYLLGDYIDRGPDSKGVFDTIFDLKRKGYTVHCLRGNHEQMFLDARHYFESQTLFLMNGGEETLQSFQSKQPSLIPQLYIDFIKDLPYYLEVDNYILVHAGLNFKGNDPLLNTDDMIWVRNWYNKVDYKWLNGRYILHGHTPTSIHEIQEMADHITVNQYLNLDTGCVYAGSKKRPLGYLTAFDMLDLQLISIPCIDKVDY